MHTFIEIVVCAAEMFRDAALYVLVGFFVAGVLRGYVQPSTVLKYLHGGRFRSVAYASVLGIPIPLCSCGVVPAVAGLRKQGADKGASLAFLIATPESGVDSIALTYALLGPLLALIRPVAAFCTAIVAGITENFFSRHTKEDTFRPDMSCPIDGCCDGIDCDPETHAAHHTKREKFLAGMRFAFDDLMADIAVWFLLGLFLAGIIQVLVPHEFLGEGMGQGFFAYLAMLIVSLPLYVCATMSTPVAAALMLKGASPGAALVLLLAGPATNMATLTVVGGLMGRRALTIYLFSIMGMTLGFAFLTDWLAAGSSASLPFISPSAGSEFMPAWVETAAAVLLVGMVFRVIWIHGPRKLLARAFSSWNSCSQDPAVPQAVNSPQRPSPCTCCNSHSAGYPDAKTSGQS